MKVVELGLAHVGIGTYHLNVHADVSSVTRPQCYKTFYSQLNCMSTIFIMHINVKMPTIVGILTFISMMNASLDSMKAKKQKKSLFVNIFVFMSCCNSMLSRVEHKKGFITSLQDVLSLV